MIGKVTGVSNEGTIVVLFCEGDNGSFTIPFDQRMFQHFVDYFGDPMGIRVEYDGEAVYPLDLCLDGANPII